MKVIFSEDFYQVYTSDPAAAPGRIESVFKTIESHVEFVTAKKADRQNIAAVHSGMHIQHIENQGLYEIASLAAGGAIQSAQIGRLVRRAANRNEGGCFGILEGGYNHTVLGENVLALIQGMADES